MKKFIKNWLPPILLSFLHKILNYQYGWFGNFQTWEEAKKASTGYDNKVILQKVRNSSLKVKSGEAMYERDSVIFDEIQYSWPLLAGLMYAAAKSQGILHVIDFGGSLGSSYYQNKKFLDGLHDVSWSILEQKHFVDVGRLDFEDDRLKFYYDINNCIEKEKPSVLLVSGVLQYLEKPYEILDELLSYGFEYILLDRTTLTINLKTRLAVQKVPKKITGASYPIWLFTENELLNYFQSHRYRLIETFYEYENYGKDVVSKGYLYEKDL